MKTRISSLWIVENYVEHAFVLNFLVVELVRVVNVEVEVGVEVEVEELDVDHRVGHLDHLGHENHLVLMMFVTNVEVKNEENFLIEGNDKETWTYFQCHSCLNWNEKRSRSVKNLIWLRSNIYLDRGHYAYDCEIRLRRQRRLR